MPVGQKLAGAMGKSPSMAGMTRVSPGIYRNAEGQLVRGQGGEPMPRQQQAPNQATANAITGQQSYGNVPPMQNMQTLDLKYGPGQGPTKEDLGRMFGQMQQPQQPQMTPQNFQQMQYDAMRASKDKGTLPLMGRSMQSRQQSYEQNVAAGQNPEEAARQQGLVGWGMKGQMPYRPQMQQQQQPIVPMPRGGYRS